MYTDIYKQLRTKQELDELIYEIDILLESLYQTNGEAFDSILKTKVRGKIFDIFSAAFSGGADKKKYLLKLKENLSKTTYLNLVLAIEPSNDFLDRISFFVKKSISPDVVLDINYDPGILGGAVMIYQGNYRDFSFRKSFQEEFARSRDKIFQTLEVKQIDTNGKL